MEACWVEPSRYILVLLLTAVSYVRFASGHVAPKDIPLTSAGILLETLALAEGAQVYLSQ